MKSRYLIFLLLLCACSASKKAQRVATREEKARKEHMQLLVQARGAFPCDTVRSVSDTITQYLPGDTITIDGIRVVTDTMFIVRNNTVKLIDRAHIALLRDSLAQSEYIYSLLAEELAAMQGEVQDQLLARHKAEKSLSDMQDKRDYWRGVALALIGMVGIAAIFKVKKIFT
jgi:hypothetical protein